MMKVSQKSMLVYFLCEAFFLAVMTIINLAVDGILTGANKQVVTDPTSCGLLSFTGKSVGSQVMQYSIIGLPLVVSTVIYIRLSWIAHIQRQQIQVLNVTQASSSVAETAITTLDSSTNPPVTQQSTANGNQGNEKRAERRRVNMVGIILLITYLSMMPVLLIKLVISMEDKSPQHAMAAIFLKEILQSLFFINSLLNPIVYPFRIAAIKNAVKNMCGRRNTF